METTKRDERLKHCPHCGPFQSYCDVVQSDINHRWQVFCGRCGSSSGSCRTEDKAIELWNQRPVENLAIAEYANMMIAYENCNPEVGFGPSDSYIREKCEKYILTDAWR